MAAHSSLMDNDQHGGQLITAMAEYGGRVEEWLDLSTGINPNGWVPTDIPAECWQRLPEQDDGLQLAATGYYGASSLLLTAGSQAAIQALPKLFACQRVGIFSPGYFEHEKAWRLAGHEVTSIHSDQPDLDAIDSLVVINPNNPTGKLLSIDQLLTWHQVLADKGGQLIVDEAFIDTRPKASLGAFCPRPGLIVLRSLGKFFGLAGIRLGAVMAAPPILSGLEKALGPWCISHPSRWVAQQAFADTDWQQRTRSDLARQSQRLQLLLEAHFDTEAKGTFLFQTVHLPYADTVFTQLAQRRILVRLFKDYNLLRFGLPANETEWSTLSGALSEISTNHLSPSLTPKRSEF